MRLGHRHKLPPGLELVARDLLELAPFAAKAFGAIRCMRLGIDNGPICDLDGLEMKAGDEAAQALLGARRDRERDVEDGLPVGALVATARGVHPERVDTGCGRSWQRD